MDERCGLVGKLPERVLFEEAQRVGENGDGRQRLAVGGRDERVPAQQFLVVQCHFEFVEVEPLSGFAGRQVVIEVPRWIAERVELLRRIQ